MTQIIEAVEDSPLIQVPKHTTNQNKTFYHQNNLPPRCNYGKCHQRKQFVP
jgi:hypothetical protein